MNDRTLNSVCDRMRRAYVRSQVTYADVCIFASQRGPDLGLRPAAYERTRPVTDFPLWMLTGSDLTLGSCWE